MEVDATGMSRHLDEQDPAPGYEGLIAHTSMAPDGYFLDWAPGHTPYVAPDGMAFPVEENSDLVLMLHLRPSGKQELVQASVGLYFTDTPPTRVPALLRLTRQDLDIPAGESHHVVATSYRLPVDVDVYTVQPHAHNLAREIEGFATLPDGTRQTAAVDQGLGLQLAGCLPVCHAGGAAGRHVGDHAVDLRQLVGQSGESERAAEGSDLRAAHFG